MKTVQEIWKTFAVAQVAKLLNPPCSIGDINEVESSLGFLLPKQLTELLILNNGQSLDKEGIFKNIAGWNIYNKLKFLDIQRILWAYNKLQNDNGLSQTIGSDLIPFATQGGKDFLGDTYAINRRTCEVFTLWTEADDWTLPEDWQLAAFKRGDNLVDFIEFQIMLYN